MNALQVILL